MKNFPKTHQVEKGKNQQKKENLRKKQMRREYQQINQPIFLAS